MVVAVADYIPLLGSGLSLEHFNTRLVLGRPCKDYTLRANVGRSTGLIFVDHVIVNLNILWLNLPGTSKNRSNNKRMC